MEFSPTGCLHNPLAGFTTEERKGRSSIVSSFSLCEMGHSAAIWDYRASNEFTTDWNGNLQAVLRNPQGASARVSFTVSPAFFVNPCLINLGSLICSLRKVLTLKCFC